jgi:hypothetical protein
MARIKVGSIAGANEVNISRIKKIMEKTNKEIKPKDDLEKAALKFEKIMEKESPGFKLQALSSDARCEIALLTFLEVDEAGNISLEAEKFFDVGKTSILAELLAVFDLKFVLTEA